MGHTDHEQEQEHEHEHEQEQEKENWNLGQARCLPHLDRRLAQPPYSFNPCHPRNPRFIPLSPVESKNSIGSFHYMFVI